MTETITQEKNELVKQIEVNEQIMLFTEFIEHQYKAQLFENGLAGKEFLTVDFQELSKFNPDLAQLLLLNPEEVIKACELSIRNFDVPKEVKNFKIRITNLSSEQRILIRDIRSHQLGRFIWTEGIVRQKSDVRPQVTTAKFECPSCGNVIPVLQLENKFREPTRCGCGRKGKFRLLSKELVDAQGIVLEEATKDLEGGAQPKRINLFLQQDLVSPMSDKRTNPGTSVRITGIIKEVPVMLKSGGQSTKFDLLIEVNHIEPVEEDYSSIQIDAKEEQEILELAKDPAICEKLAMSLAPGIYGHDKIKEALILQFAGGYSKITDDGVKKRGDIHVLLIGDPGAGKSQLLKRASVVAPKARYVSGKGVSLEHDEPLLIREDNTLKVMKIGEFVDNYSDNKENVFVPLHKNIQALSLDHNTKKLAWKDISHVFRHKTKEKLLHFEFESGREITITKDHSIYTLSQGKIAVKKSQELTTDDYILVPKKIPFSYQTDTPSGIDPLYARLLGYFIAEGHLHGKEGQYYKVEFTLGEKDLPIIEDLQIIARIKFNKELSVNNHGEHGLRVIIHGKKAYTTMISLLGDVAHKKAKEKRVPLCIFNAPIEIQEEFLTAYIQGDAGVTKSKELASDLLYLYLQQQKIASLTKNFQDRIVTMRHKLIHCYGMVYELKSPKQGKIFDHRYQRPPFSKFGMLASKYFFKKMKTSGYSRVSSNSMSNAMLLDRFFHIVQQTLCSGKDLKKMFSESILEYIGDHEELFVKQKVGREVLISISEKGDQLLDELIDMYSLLDSDLGFVKIKSSQEVENKYEYVYDISVPEYENFVGGFGGIICHNSGAGLTAAVVRDEFLGGWSLEAGALVLANKGVLMIDEMDKMSPEDRSAMHEGLEQQTISISKANIQATLRCDTTVLAAANPKFGRFDPYETINKQIDMPPALINRFDLIFVIKDLPDEEQDKKIAKFILTMHKDHQTQQVPINTELLRRYLIYARQKIYPHFSQEAIDVLQDYYVKMRSSGTSEDGGIKAIPISARQLDALVRLSEASAKIRLSQAISVEDAQRAIFLLQYCLQQVGIDPETGKLDIDRISIGITSSQRNKIAQVRDLINELEEALGKIIPLNELLKHAAEKGLPENVVEEALEKLKRSGDIFSPKPNHIQKI